MAEVLSDNFSHRLKRGEVCLIGRDVFIDVPDKGGFIQLNWFAVPDKDSMEDAGVQCSPDDGGEYQEIVEEVYDLIKDIKDPEREQTLEQLNVVNEDLIRVHKIDSNNYGISIGFIPTVPHCSLATLIGLCMKVKLERDLPFRHKLEILIAPGTHSTADEINKQINDKERVAAAMENPNVMEVVESCLEYVQL